MNKKLAKRANVATMWPGATMWQLDQIKPYPNNPRRHPQAQIDLLAKLIEKYGPDQPIVVDDDGVILKGHGRRLAALAAGRKDFPVFVHKGLSEADKHGIRIADNQVALLGEWDVELLRAEVFELKKDDFDLSMLGFEDKKLVNFFASIEQSVIPQLQGLKFAVIVECDSESDQTERLNQLVQMGLKCRALIS